MNTISSLRPLLRLAEAAQRAQDDDLARTALMAAEVLARDNPPIDMTPILAYMRALTSSCDHCYMTCDDAELAALRHQAMRELAQYNESRIAANDQKVLRLGPVVRLVTAMYVRQEGDMMKGVSVAFVIDENGVVQFPRRGPLIDELQEYCDDGNPPLRSLAHWLPNELAGYRLMAGSFEVQEVLPEELQEMSW